MNNFLNQTTQIVDEVIDRLKVVSFKIIHEPNPLIKSQLFSMKSMAIKIVQTFQEDKEETIFSFINQENTLMSIRRLQRHDKPSQIFFYVGDVYHQNTIDCAIAEKMFNRFAYMDCLVTLKNMMNDENVISIKDKIHPQVKNILKFRK